MEKKSSLEYAVIETTGKCQLSCNWCYNSSGKLKEMSTEEIKKIGRAHV